MASLENGERRTIHRYGSSARYVPTGYLVYMRGESLMAAPFDLTGSDWEGANELVVAVSEDFGGWGVQARFPDPEGLTL